MSVFFVSNNKIQIACQYFVLYRNIIQLACQFISIKKNILKKPEYVFITEKLLKHKLLDTHLYC